MVNFGRLTLIAGGLVATTACTSVVDETTENIGGIVNASISSGDRFESEGAALAAAKSIGVILVRDGYGKYSLVEETDKKALVEAGFNQDASGMFIGYRTDGLADDFMALINGKIGKDVLPVGIDEISVTIGGFDRGDGKPDGGPDGGPDGETDGPDDRI